MNNFRLFLILLIFFIYGCRQKIVDIVPEKLNSLSEAKELAFYVNYTNPGDAKIHNFDVYVSSEAEHIVFKTFKDWVSVKVDRGLKMHFADSSGLLGSFLTGEKMARDGVTVLDDPIAFGNEWQVLDSEPMLFESARSPQYPAECKLPLMTEQTQRRLGETLAYEAAAKACSHWENKQDQCIFDVMASGDLEVAEAGAF